MAAHRPTSDLLLLFSQLPVKAIKGEPGGNTHTHARARTAKSTSCNEQTALEEKETKKTRSKESEREGGGVCGGGDRAGDAMQRAEVSMIMKL